MNVGRKHATPRATVASWLALVLLAFAMVGLASSCGGDDLIVPGSIVIPTVNDNSAEPTATPAN